MLPKIQGHSSPHLILWQLLGKCLLWSSAGIDYRAVFKMAWIGWEIEPPHFWMSEYLDILVNLCEICTQQHYSMRLPYCSQKWSNEAWWNRGLLTPGLTAGTLVLPDTGNYCPCLCKDSSAGLWAIWVTVWAGSSAASYGDGIKPSKTQRYRTHKGSGEETDALYWKPLAGAPDGLGVQKVWAEAATDDAWHAASPPASGIAP